MCLVRLQIRMRTLNDIRLEIEAATERRSELWHRLSAEGYDAAAREELERLSEEIAKLWDEQRELRARVRFGDRDQIVQRARAEERLNRAA
jgi:hypothetical protein